ncbi:MAG: MFS transporter [Mycobacteriales bacterium]
MKVPLGRRWWVLAAVTVSAFITNVDATIVVVGLPRMVAGLHTTVTTGLWTLTGYLITSTIFLLPAGRWSDLIGRKRIFLTGLAIFTASTVGCGLSSGGAELVGFRFVQGAGAALALATATPLLVEAFPASELGRALGLNSTSWVLGSIVGPVAGGALVGTLGWRWIFWVTVPFALVGFALAWRHLPSDVRTTKSVRTDWGGMLTFGVALFALLLALSQGLAWGWASPRILGAFAATAILLVAFAAYEYRAVAPLFDLRLLRNPPYRDGLVITVTYGIGFFATTFLLTFYLQGALRLSPLIAGLMLVPLSGPQLLFAPLGGWLSDRFGPVRPLLAGVSLLVISALLLGGLGTRLSIPVVVFPLLVMSAANGLAWPSLVKLIMSNAPANRLGSASGMFYTVRNAAMSLSLTLALVVAEVSLPPATAVRVFIGTNGLLAPHAAGQLVRATDDGFRVFAACYLAAVITTSLLYLRNRRGVTAVSEPAAAPEPPVSVGQPGGPLGR